LALTQELYSDRAALQLVA